MTQPATPPNPALKVAVLLAAIAQPVVSALPNLIPGFSRPIGEVSDKFNTFIVPAGYAFAIWGLIFGLCLIYAVLQLRSSPQANLVFAATRYMLLVAMLGNCGWMIAFPKEVPWLPLVLIWVILLALLKGLQNLRGLAINGWQPRLVQVLMSIFAGWLSVAAFANIALAALESGWLPGHLRGAWDAATLAAAAALILAVNKRESGNWLYTAVIAWATLAIAIKQWPRPELAATICALLALTLLVTVVAQTWWLSGRRKK
jgi:hypothetical protein